MAATWSSRRTALGAEYLDRLGYDPEAMIDVVRLLKNQEMLEIQMARAGESPAARLSRRLRLATPTTTRA